MKKGKKFYETKAFRWLLAGALAFTLLVGGTIDRMVDIHANEQVQTQGVDPAAEEAARQAEAAAAKAAEEAAAAKAAEEAAAAKAAEEAAAAKAAEEAAAAKAAEEAAAAKAAEEAAAAKAAEEAAAAKAAEEAAAEPTAEPTVEPTAEPTAEPTVEPTAEPTVEPTAEPTVEPTAVPATGRAIFMLMVDGEYEEIGKANLQREGAMVYVSAQDMSAMLRDFDLSAYDLRNAWTWGVEKENMKPEDADQAYRLQDERYELVGYDAVAQGADVVVYAAEAYGVVTAEPVVEPTAEPTVEPTAEPTVEPTAEPAVEPTAEPTVEPVVEPTVEPTAEPEATAEPTESPEATVEPTAEPELSATPSEAIPEEKPVQAVPVLTEGEQSLTLYAAPDGLEALAELPADATLTVVELGEEWTLVRCGEFTGYVATAKIALLNPAPVAPEEEETAPVVRSISITSNLDGQTEVVVGTPVTLTATLGGFEDVQVALQWQCSTDGGATFADLPEATDTALTFNIDMNNVNYLWRLKVTVLPEAQPEPAQPDGAPQA